MSKYALITDATVDMPWELIQELDIDVMPMAVQFDEEEFMHYADEREMSVEDFYERIRNGGMPKTAQITPNTFIEKFESYLSQGIDVLNISFSSGLSGTYESSVLAKEELETKYPDRKIYTLDSLAASVGLCFFMYQLGKKRQEGATIDELYQYAVDNRLRVAHWFTVDNLNHLYRGGRISKTTAVLGGALNIKPMLIIDKEGHLVSNANVRGIKKAVAYMVQKLEQDGDGGDTVVIGHAVIPEAAEELKETILKKGLAKNVIVSKIGPIIGTHVGPGMFALVFYNKDTVKR